MPDDSVTEALRVYVSFLLGKVRPPPSLAELSVVSFGFTVITCTVAGKPWYFVEPAQRPDIDVRYQVAVNDPLTVNQILRNTSLRSRYQIARMLVRKGIPFKTFRPYPYPRHLMYPPPEMPMFTKEVPMGLGIRLPSDNTFTRQDYEVYEEQRDELIRSLHGRGGFLEGGITWRGGRE